MPLGRLVRLREKRTTTAKIIRSEETMRLDNIEFEAGVVQDGRRFQRLIETCSPVICVTVIYFVNLLSKNALPPSVWAKPAE